LDGVRRDERPVLEVKRSHDERFVERPVAVAAVDQQVSGE
jgi:hypothetical protein